MEKQAIFVLSVIFRLTLAMIIPIQIVSSMGVTSTILTGFGMSWLFSETNIEFMYLSIVLSLFYSVPAVWFSVYFRYINKKSYPMKTAVISSILIFILPILGQMALLPFGNDIYLSDQFIPLSYSFTLLVLFIILPSLNFIFQSLSLSFKSHEAFLSIIAFFCVLFFPFISLYHIGLYGSEQILMSSIFISTSSVREGWTEETAIYYLHPSLIIELNSLLSVFYIILLLRILFLFASIAYFLGKTSITKASIVGLFQETILYILAAMVNTSIPPTNYYTTGVTPITILFPCFLLFFLIHRKLIHREIPEEEYIKIPILVTVKQQITAFRDRFTTQKLSNHDT